VFRVEEKGGVHWNNEAEPLRLWLDPPAGWEVTERLLAAAAPKAAVSAEARRLEFEVKAPATARGAGRLAGYAVFHVCDARGGTCRFVRVEVAVEVPVRR
jgi:hypothetical protein